MLETMLAMLVLFGGLTAYYLYSKAKFDRELTEHFEQSTRIQEGWEHNFELLEKGAEEEKLKVFIRDGGKCKYCGSPDELTAVYIGELSPYTEHSALTLVTQPDLFITMCYSCSNGNITPLQFEKSVSSLLKKRGHLTRHIGGPGDEGIDIRATFHGNEIVVQCKRYADKVGVGALRDFYGAMISAGTNTGYFFTTGGFTEGAISFALKNNIVLFDGKKVAKLLAHDASPLV